MSIEKNIKEKIKLNDDELIKVTGGDGDPQTQTATTKVKSTGAINSYYVDCPFCNSRQFLGDRWGRYDTITLQCGCILETMRMTNVRITKKVQAE